MNVRLLGIAELELNEAISYYNGQQAGLGDAFVVAVAHAHRRPDYWRERLRR